MRRPIVMLLIAAVVWLYFSTKWASMRIAVMQIFWWMFP